LLILWPRNFRSPGSACQHGFALVDRYRCTGRALDASHVGALGKSHGNVRWESHVFEIVVHRFGGGMRCIETRFASPLVYSWEWGRERFRDRPSPQSRSHAMKTFETFEYGYAATTPPAEIIARTNMPVRFGVSAVVASFNQKWGKSWRCCG
jgi:hypothetical protein